jgi:hypothetical protein
MRAANLEHGLEGLPKCSLSQAGTWKFRSPQKIWVAEDELNRRSPVNRTRAIDDPSRQYDICQDLDIERPVARVMENEDRGYWCRREINWLQPPRLSINAIQMQQTSLGRHPLLRGEVMKWPDTGRCAR